MSRAHLPTGHAIDKAWARRAFDRASGTYDAAAILQREVGAQLLQRLDLTVLEPRVVLDVGAGTGHGGRALKRRYPSAEVLAIDSSLGMLRAAGRQQSWFRPFRRVCADAEHLPLGDGSVDLILSNFMLPWSDPDAAFAECRRVLAARGLLTFTTLGPDTLMELRAAWQAGGDAHSDAAARLMPLLDMHDVGDALVRAGFAAPVLDVERYTLRYTEVRGLVADLKALGSRNASTGRPKGLTGPRTFAAMQRAYERFRVDGRLPATCEVVFGHAWAPDRRAAAPGPAAVALADVQRQLPSRRER